VSLTLIAGTLFGPRAARHLGPVLVSPEFTRERPQELGRWLRLARATAPIEVLRQIGAVLGSARRVEAISCPTLILTGSADRLIPPSNSRDLWAKIPGARLVELPGAGHAFPLEREEETARLITSHFLTPPER
jgi:pimeloyl-ACP methyl ester carboxylesterase